MLRVLTWMNPTALLSGNVWHELVHFSKERVVVVVVVVVVVEVAAAAAAAAVVVVVFISGTSEIAVGARCTDVRANELLCGKRMLWIPHVE